MPTPRLILHVDDDPQFTRLVAAQLGAVGYEVHTLNDATQCLPTLMRQQYRLVLLDLNMPALAGEDLLPQIKTFDGGIQVIVVTAAVSMNRTLQVLRRGAEACFFKPLTDLRPLGDAVEDAFKKLDRWWDTLDHLMKLRRSDAKPAKSMQVTTTT